MPTPDTAQIKELDGPESIKSLASSLRVLSDFAREQIDADRLARAAALLDALDALDAERAARVAAEADASAARKRVRELVDEVARLQAKVTELAMDRLIADSADLILNDVKPEAKP